MHYGSVFAPGIGRCTARGLAALGATVALIGRHGELDRDGCYRVVGSGGRVNAVAPGYIASSGMDHYPPEMGPMLREMAKTLPLCFGNFGAALVHMKGLASRQLRL